MNAAREREYWRVGYHADPAGFVPRELCAWNHRFDDIHHRFRSIYVAELDETAIREVLADLRPKAAAIARYVERFGPEAADDVPSQPVTASWRRQHVLAQVLPMLKGSLIDLCDADVRYELERAHAALLAEYEMDHLDLSEATAKLRLVTQTIAADVYDRLGAAGIRFPSRLDGNACVVVFEGRGTVGLVAESVALTDPAPPALQNVCAGWRLTLEPTSSGP